MRRGGKPFCQLPVAFCSQQVSASCQAHFSTLDSCTKASKIQQMDEQSKVRTKDKVVEEVMNTLRGKRKEEGKEKAIPERIQPA